MVDRTNLPPTVTEAESETLDLRDERRTFNAGQVVGDRYQILALLGRGGMGEVWHAFDLKLRVEVALKALRSDIFKNERRRESLRQEVRSARDVVSPNVCRLYDLHELEGLELVSMEFVDGQTLLEVMRERAPLDLQEAQDIASQFLAGLEAIHQIGLVHRDIKPENIMLTRAGRVVVMDFGIAREEHEGSGTVSGTAAYMAPEQAAGQSVDARADLYSAGIVLAEMVNPDGLKNRESRESVWEAVKAEPANIPDTPWASVITKAVAKDRDHRFNSATDLTRALEEVTLRVAGADDLHPYPGLAAFTEEDSEYFFGREAEVELMWRKMDRPHLLAITGPSGAGKTSFLRAGLFPSAGPDWRLLRLTPGSNPFAAFGQAMAREMAGDMEAVQLLALGQESNALVTVVSRWRSLHKYALLIVDQFEELFTHNTIEVQRRFSEFLMRIALEGDVFVLLSMRDDFLLRCREHESLNSIFTGLTALLPPTGPALHRAIKKPANNCGYRFEDDELVGEMLEEVQGERGTLPLLAFALARLWEKRDRDSGLLTRQAYVDIGGVGGALAQHAEATIDRIGTEHIAIVRELFRNLVTAEETRAVRGWNELVSVFNDSPRGAPDDVLGELIDARLLTSYEVRDEDKAPTRMVEIIHESLLANWPRLVRWQTQDADGAQLRDQLRQAAKTWDDQGRADDTLWTGSAYLDFAAWRKSYPGGLTEIEEAFASAMTSFATRRHRRRRLAASTTFIVLLMVLGIVGVSRQQAIAETDRAEASKLLALGKFALEEDRTAALAYAIASLERSNSPEARRLALSSLWQGPPATGVPGTAVPSVDAWYIVFAPDGSRMLVGYNDGVARVFTPNLEPPVELRDFEDRGITALHSFSRDAKRVIGWVSKGSEFRTWTTKDWQTERVFRVAGVEEGIPHLDHDGYHVLSIGFRSDDKMAAPAHVHGNVVVHRWPEGGGEPEILGSVEATQKPNAWPDPTRQFLVTGMTRELRLHRLDSLGRTPPRIIGRHPADFSFRSWMGFSPSGDQVGITDSEGNLLLWLVDGDGHEPARRMRVPAAFPVRFSPDGSHLAAGHLWDLCGPQGAEGVRLDTSSRYRYATFTPGGHWVATAGSGVNLWPRTDRYCRVLRGHEGRKVIRFAHDGTRLFSRGDDGRVLSWDLSAGAGIEPVVLFQTDPQYSYPIAVDPHGRFLIVGGMGGVWQIPLDDNEPTQIENFPRQGIAIDPSGRLIASNRWSDHFTPNLEVLHLETGQRSEIEPPGEGAAYPWGFDKTGQLWAFKEEDGILSRWDPTTGQFEILFEDLELAAGSADGDYLIQKDGQTRLFDPVNGSETEFPLYGDPGFEISGPEGSIVAKTESDGAVHVWSLADQNPHLLLGSDGPIVSVAVSPDGKWVAAAGLGATIQLWPMPDLSAPPFHTLPLDEVLIRLKKMTNLRAVPDPEFSTGYRIEADANAYRGWAEVPEW